MKSATVLDQKRVADHDDGIQPESYIADPCPICGQRRPQKWLLGQDRLHGRKKNYTLMRCPACTLVWLSDPPKPEEMHLHYTAAYDKLITGNNSPGRWKWRKAHLLCYKHSGTLLDLGCSSGSFLESVYSEQWKLYGIEMSSAGAKMAEARSRAKVYVGDILNAPFPEETFDVITCFDVLEHLYEPQKVMQKVAGWLKPDGIFYVQVPNIDSAEARVFGSYWHGLELPRHLFHYSPLSLKFLAESMGLREVSVETRRNPAVGTSLHYIWDDVFGSIGICRTPVAYRGEAGLPWKIGRKLLRLTLLRLLLAMAPLAGGGEAIHAMFRKPVDRSPAELK